jgi:hypothetical protein
LCPSGAIHLLFPIIGQRQYLFLFPFERSCFASNLSNKIFIRKKAKRHSNFQEKGQKWHIIENIVDLGQKANTIRSMENCQNNVVKKDEERKTN